MKFYDLQKQKVHCDLKITLSPPAIYTVGKHTTEWNIELCMKKEQYTFET